MALGFGRDWSLRGANVRTIEADEAEPRFDELLADVENGETIMITRHGMPFALFEPVRAEDPGGTAAIEAPHQSRREDHLNLEDGVTIQDHKVEGRE